MSLRGSKSKLFARSSQKGDPVSGLKCHSTISRTCASSASLAAFIFACMSAVAIALIGSLPFILISDQRRERRLAALMFLDYKLKRQIPLSGFERERIE